MFRAKGDKWRQARDEALGLLFGSSSSERGVKVQKTSGALTRAH